MMLKKVTEVVQINAVILTVCVSAFWYATGRLPPAEVVGQALVGVAGLVAMYAVGFHDGRDS